MDTMGSIDTAKNIRQKIITKTMGNHVVFHHVPKCGGTSVGRALRKKYILSQATVKPEQSYRAFAAFTQRSDRDQLMIDVLDLREQMLLYLLYDDVRCVSAHVRFSPIAHNAFKETYKFVTVLRDPVDRFISNYFWIAGRPHEHPFVEGSFEDFLQTPSAQRMGANYVEYYCGLDKDADIRSQIAIESAIENLNKFNVVGQLDRLSEFKNDIQDVLGVRLKIGHENKMKQSKSVKKNTVTPELRQRVSELCKPDIQVWQSVAS